MFESYIHNLQIKGFHQEDNFLPLEQFLSIQTHIQEMYNHGAGSMAKIGPKEAAINNTTIRNDRIIWLDEEDEQPGLQFFFTKLRSLKTAFNQSLYLGLFNLEAHFACYPPGSFYNKHSDQFINKKDRILSCVYYLNPAWLKEDGGELLIYNDNNKVITSCLPQGNRFICFESHLYHEVTMAHKLRFSIALWFKKLNPNPLYI